LVLAVFREEFTELGIRLKDVGDALGRIETGNLNNVFAAPSPQAVSISLSLMIPRCQA